MPDNCLSGICGYNFFAKYMWLKILSKRFLLLVVSIVFIIFVVFFFIFIPQKSIQQGSQVILVENAIAQSNQEQVNQEDLGIGLPAYLRIPVIGVDATVISVGLTLDGAMDVPKGPDDVAWFSLGSRPGESGSSVIAGHYGWENNIPAVFDNLHKLRKGDNLSVEDENGIVTTFVVREIRIYGKDDVASDVFGSDDGKAHLNLITCTGWNNVEKTFSERLILFTDKE